MTDHESAAMLASLHASANDREAAGSCAELAIYRAERIVISDPKNGAAFASGACGLAALGHAERSRKWLRKALNTDPGNLAMRYSLASTLALLLEDLDGAVEMLEPFAEGMTTRIQLALLDNDPCWGPLRGLQRFVDLANRARKRVESLRPCTPAIQVTAGIPAT